MRLCREWGGVRRPPVLLAKKLLLLDASTRMMHALNFPRGPRRSAGPELPAAVNAPPAPSCSQPLTLSHLSACAPLRRSQPRTVPSTELECSSEEEGAAPPPPPVKATSVMVPPCPLRSHTCASWEDASE